MTLKLSWPPSLNRYWRRAGSRMHLSHEGRSYRADVIACCLEQKADRLGTQRVAIVVTAHPPDRRQRDLDNLTKGLLDSLQHARVFDDDSQVDHLAITRGAVKRGGQLLVTIEPLTDPAHQALREGVGL